MELKSIKLEGIKDERPMVITGPCSAETHEQVMNTAKELSALGFQIFRAGVWKPRTKPGGFEGIGKEALGWLQDVKANTGMYVATEVATSNHVLEAVKHQIDILWIGARTTVNPFAVQEIADTLQSSGFDGPVLIKNPVNPDLELWIGAIERIYNAGIKKIGAIHRGFSSYDKSIYRNIPQWYIPIELKRRIPNLPLFSDPSHIGGRRELIAPLSQQAMDLNYDGLMIESHASPDDAWSDKQQQITPEKLISIINKLIIREAKQSTENLSDLRRQIDLLDNQLFALISKRMEVSKEIGLYKREHNISILQTERYDQMLEKRLKEAEELGLDSVFIKRVLDDIHEESIRQQSEILNR